MMAKEPAERYQKPADVVAALTASVTEPVDPPPAQEMPEHPAAFYRLGLSPAPGAGSASALAVTPNPHSQAETMPSPKPAAWDLPPALTPQPRTPPSGGSSVPSIMLAPPPSAPHRLRSARRFRRLVRLGELLLFVLAAGGVGWLASREWMHRAVQPGPEPGPAAIAPKEPFAGPVVNGGGVTFVDPLMQRWAGAYEKQHGVRVDYQSVGVNKGVQGVLDRVYLFGCTVVPLTDEQVADAGGEIIHIPLTLGAVAIAYNLPDVHQPIRFTGPVLADIYLGKVKRWNDPALGVSNPGVPLPDLPIVVVYHAEPTGTTHVWTEYLSAASAEWKQRFGARTEHAWPVGSGAKANDGTADTVSRTVGAIGYLEQSFALANNLPVGEIKNRDGKFVPASPAGVTEAAAGVLRTIPGDLRFSLTDAPGEGAYPIAGAAWAILYADQSRRPSAHELVEFLRWATHEGQAYATELKFAPLPPDLVKRIDDRLAAVRVK
jgi:phosphate transport system substrate-binding protein